MKPSVTLLCIAASVYGACAKHQPPKPYGQVRIWGRPYVNGGSVTIFVSADFSFDRVEILDAGIWHNVPAPFQYVWDTAGRPEGVYRFRARGIAPGGSIESDWFEIHLDRTPPRVMNVSPAPGATAMPGAPIIVEFDEPMYAVNWAGSPGVLLVSQARGALDAGFSLADDAGQRIEVVTARPRTAPDELTVTIAASVTDLAGNALGRETTWSFTLSSPWELLGGGPVIPQGLAWYGPSAFVASGMLHATASVYVSKLVEGAWQPVTMMPSCCRITTDGTDIWTDWVPIQRWNGTVWETLTSPIAFAADRWLGNLHVVKGTYGPVATWTEEARDAQGAVLSTRLHGAMWGANAWTEVAPLLPEGNYARLMDVTVSGGVPHVLYFEGAWGWTVPLSGHLRVARLDPSGWTVLPGTITSDGSEAAIAPDLWVAAVVPFGLNWAGLTAWEPVKNGWSSTGLGVGLPVGTWGFPDIEVDGNGTHFLSYLQDSMAYTAVHVLRWNGLRWEEPWGVLNLDPAVRSWAPRLAVDLGGAIVATWAEWVGENVRDEFRTYVKRLSP